MTTYSYEILPRAADVGGGWRLRLLEDGDEVGGGVFPADPNYNPDMGMEWWNARSETERAMWMDKAGNTGRAVDAWGAYLAAEAHFDANEEGDAWVSAKTR